MSPFQEPALDNVDDPYLHPGAWADFTSPVVQSPVDFFGSPQTLSFEPSSAPSGSLYWGHGAYTGYGNDLSMSRSASLNTTLNGDHFQPSLLDLDIADLGHGQYEQMNSNLGLNARESHWASASAPSSYPPPSPFGSISFMVPQPMSKTESTFSGTSNHSTLEQDEYSYVTEDSGWSKRGGVTNTLGLDRNMIPSGSASVPIPMNANPRKGRKGPLTTQKRASTAYMRRIKACALCRKRKISCDHGIPCRACVRYLGDRLHTQPCRGEQLKDIASEIMRDNAFPKGNWETRFLLSGFEFGHKILEIFLDLGFGQPFKCLVRLVQPTQEHGQAGGHSYPLLHHHIEYPWPPAFSSSPRNDRQDLVFPAALALSSEAHFENEIDAYLSALLNESINFRYFPLWMSELQLLKCVYRYYASLPIKCRQPLEQALKLLVLIHTGGDLRVIPEPTSQSIVRSYFPNISLEKVTPCLIRAQLGPIFSQMSHKYMRQVLMELELLSLTDDASKFPMIVGTFSVLMMAMESLQYHVTKLPYHTHLDGPAPDLAEWEPQSRDLDDMDKSEVLIRFYKATKCHDRLSKLGSPPRHQGSDGFFLDYVPCDAETKKALTSMHEALVDARPYLVAKSRRSVFPGTDMTAFFDRLLAKMFIE